MLNPRRVATSAPGSLMLMGEHAVLRNHLALSASVNRRLSLELVPRPDRVLQIDSNIGKACFKPAELPTDGPFRFVATCIRAHADFFSEGGFDLRIRSELPTTVGLGSSAALVVALVHAIQLLQGQKSDSRTLHQSAWEVIRAVQGRGSGADVAASVLGGCVAYRVAPFQMRKIACLPPLAVYYSGAKRATSDVIAEVDAFEQRHPILGNALFDSIGALSIEAQNALASRDWNQLGELMNMGQGFMDAMGVNNARLSEMIYALRNAQGVWGSKISGSGLGDCVIALGAPHASVLSNDRIDVSLAEDGVREEVA